MAKTIKELAEEQFPIAKWEEMRAATDCRKIFCMGANAVLDLIEGATMNDVTAKEKYRNVLEVIYDLRGWDKTKINVK